MLIWLKRLTITLLILLLVTTASVYGVLSLSLPTLDGKGSSAYVSDSVEIARDGLGQAVISAHSRADAAYGLGYAHGQDRFFQMDLLRRNAAGELSELFGAAAIELDKSMRFHQFRQRAKQIVQTLPAAQQQVLQRYAQGVNEGRQQAGYTSFEYLLLAAEPTPWQPEDSLLSIFSMYLDLQAGTIERDETLLLLEQQFGQPMLDFLLQPSQYQAALDGSRLAREPVAIPKLDPDLAFQPQAIADKPHYGSNNWAVTGAYTNTGAAMLSDDMHLGLDVPSIWYRAQLNYQQDGQAVQVTGVSLPGAPAIVVGSNQRIAWGFTNAYLDTADWIALSPDDDIHTTTEVIKLADGSEHRYELKLSDYGPVKEIAGKQYALSWVAHQDYAVNLDLLKLETASTTTEALSIARYAGIPVQNLLVVDDQGSAAWTPMGALPARQRHSDTAIPAAQYQASWRQNETMRPQYVNPATGKLWTANSRVVSANAHERFGDGGYALGARAVQIRDVLTAKHSFSEQDFYDLQLDNRALFLTPWQQQLKTLLASQDTARFQEDLNALNNWQGCACPDSVGYTLVKYYRNSLIEHIFAPLEQALVEQQLSLARIKRYLEPALWQILEQQPTSWLGDNDDWSQLQLRAYQDAKAKLRHRFGSNMAAWRWGDVNALQVQHPFSKQMPILSGFLDMPVAQGFGDTFMPAVQGRSFGASQRLIAQPGHLEHAILTIAGGQSGHPLSPFYRAGFEQYVAAKATPLLPGTITHRIEIQPD
ncbi:MULTISPECIES: penicillin acylase family protein [unclassified Pseudoalteromonas]|uniref:penicillin acylase family protein n=1 Tax=unclassified Pseudoalteromonas TaxID=194690 RepID=UPI003014D732